MNIFESLFPPSHHDRRLQIIHSAGAGDTEWAWPKGNEALHHLGRCPGACLDAFGSRLSAATPFAPQGMPTTMAYFLGQEGLLQRSCHCE